MIQFDIFAKFCGKIRRVSRLSTLGDSSKLVCSFIDLTGSWNAAICDAMAPKEGDVVVKGKKGLDAFPNTDLEEILVKKGIDTVALGGFLTNCCVESTMRLV